MTAYQMLFDIAVPVLCQQNILDNKCVSSNLLLNFPTFTPLVERPYATIRAKAPRPAFLVTCYGHPALRTEAFCAGGRKFCDIHTSSCPRKSVPVFGLPRNGHEKSSGGFYSITASVIQYLAEPRLAFCFNLCGFPVSPGSFRGLYFADTPGLRDPPMQFRGFSHVRGRRSLGTSA